MARCFFGLGPQEAILHLNEPAPAPSGGAARQKSRIDRRSPPASVQRPPGGRTILSRCRLGICYSSQPSSSSPFPSPYFCRRSSLRSSRADPVRISPAGRFPSRRAAPLASATPRRGVIGNTQKVRESSVGPQACRSSDPATPAHRPANSRKLCGDHSDEARVRPGPPFPDRRSSVARWYAARPPN